MLRHCWVVEVRRWRLGPNALVGLCRDHLLMHSHSNPVLCRRCDSAFIDSSSNARQARQRLEDSESAQLFLLFTRSQQHAARPQSVLSCRRATGSIYAMRHSRLMNLRDRVSGRSKSESAAMTHKRRSGLSPVACRSRLGKSSFPFPLFPFRSIRSFSSKKCISDTSTSFFSDDHNAAVLRSTILGPLITIYYPAKVWSLPVFAASCDFSNKSLIRSPTMKLH